MRQSTAKELSERLTKKPCKLKQLNGRCCIFVNRVHSTDFYGLSWTEAVDKLVVKYGHPELASTHQP